MQVISFINMKGGVGKTTLATNVAYGLAFQHKKKVLIVDSDPQFNASQYLMPDDDYLAHTTDKKKRTVRDIFVPRQAPPVRTVAGPGKVTNNAKMPLASCSFRVYEGTVGLLDLIPSTLELMDIETSKRGTENRLRGYLSLVAQSYDYVIIDCPPTMSIFTQSAILASQKYLVPIKPDPLSVTGLPLLERWLDEFQEEQGMELENVGLVFTMVRGPVPKAMAAVIDDLRQRRKGQVFTSYLSQGTAVAEAVEVHQPLCRFKRGKAADQMTAITAEFLHRTSGS